jgi:hypothetical protein
MDSNRLSRTGLRLAAVVALVVPVAACEAPTSPQFVAHTLLQPLEGACPADDVSLKQGEFVSEVTSFAATITGPDIDEPIVGTGDGSIIIDTVPAGADRIVALYGLVGGQARWRGVSGPQTFAADKPSTVDVVLAAIADFSCARSTTNGEHAFHTATALDDGTVLIVGGARAMADASGTCGGPCLRATAGNTAAVYDPKTGTFTSVGSLDTARMFHTAAKLPDGRVVIAGGSSEAFFFPQSTASRPFPISPEGPVASVEVYDPKTGSFESAGSDPGGARIFAAATTTLDGEVIITGGIPSKAQTGANDLGNALRTTTLCSGSTVNCRTGPAMASARAGHQAFTTDPEGTFLWGGAVQTDAGDAGYFHIENLAPAATAFERLTRASMQNKRNLFFAGGALYLDYRFVVAGGLTRELTGTVATFSTENAAHVHVFDATANDPQGKGGVTLPQDLQAPRLFASVAGLPDEATSIIVGGFEIGSLDAISWTGSDKLDLFTDTPEPATSTIRVNNAARTLRQPRAGATATAIGDGTIVIVGGYNANVVAETAEIFADINTPPQAAEFAQ